MLILANTTFLHQFAGNFTKFGEIMLVFACESMNKPADMR